MTSKGNTQMKKLAAFVAVLALAGCGRSEVYETTQISQGYRIDPCTACAYIYVTVWTDPVTGCESYVTDDGFMSPRLGPDGMQRCLAEQPGVANDQ